MGEVRSSVDSGGGGGGGGAVSRAGDIRKSIMKQSKLENFIIAEEVIYPTNTNTVKQKNQLEILPMPFSSIKSRIMFVGNVP